VGESNPHGLFVNGEEPMSVCLNDQEFHALVCGLILPADERTRIDTHLSECDECRGELTRRGGSGSGSRVGSGSGSAVVDAPTLIGSDAPSTGYLDKYEPGTEIGEGGQAVVYKVRHRNLGVFHALKVLDRPKGPRRQSIEARFEREAKAASRLDHPNIVRVFDCGHDERSLYYIMSFVDGEPLDLMVQRVAPLSPHASPEAFREAIPCATEPGYHLQVAAWMADVAGALQYAHDHGVVHRDIKPANIIVDRNARPMLTDFGLAKDVFTDQEVSLDGRPHGTPGYMSPEQAKGEPTDHRTDVYSLGATMYVLLTYRRAFEGANSTQTMEMVKTLQPPPPGTIIAEVPPGLEEICLKAMEKDPSDRYQTAAAIQADLRAWLLDQKGDRTRSHTRDSRTPERDEDRRRSGIVGEAPPELPPVEPSHSERSRSWGKIPPKRRWGAAAAVVVLLAVVAGTIGLLRTNVIGGGSDPTGNDNTQPPPPPPPAFTIKAILPDAHGAGKIERSTLDSPLPIEYEVESGKPSRIKAVYREASGSASQTIKDLLPGASRGTFTFPLGELSGGTYRVGVAATSGTEWTEHFADDAVFVHPPPSAQFEQPVGDVTTVTIGNSVPIDFTLDDSLNPDGIEVTWLLFYIPEADAGRVPEHELWRHGTRLDEGTGTRGSYSLPTAEIPEGGYRLGLAVTDTGRSIRDTSDDGDDYRIGVLANRQLIVQSPSPRVPRVALCIIEETDRDQATHKDPDGKCQAALRELLGSSVVELEDAPLPDAGPQQLTRQLLIDHLAKNHQGQFDYLVWGEASADWEGESKLGPNFHTWKLRLRIEVHSLARRCDVITWSFPPRVPEPIQGGVNPPYDDSNFTRWLAEAAKAINDLFKRAAAERALLEGP
jgi:serine/threonine protein kinase